MAIRHESDPLQKADSLRADVLALLREKRYEEALAVLYRARSEAPSDRQLQRSIDQIKEFLIGAYAKRLGGLDQIALPIPLPAVRSPDAVLLARYIDGSSTFGDVAQMCPLGQLRTLQVLVGLYSGAEPPRIDVEPPPSGLRGPALVDELRSAEVPPLDVEERTPDTARSSSGTSTGPLDRVPRSSELPVRASVPASQAPSAEDTRYKELFALGTAAFIKHRYAEAIEAFEACDRLRPGDKPADVMLRRSRRGLASQ